MLEKPNIPDDAIIAGLTKHYDLNVLDLTFLPLGNDSGAWVYAVITSTNEKFFLKVRRGTPYQPTVLVPRTLYDQGINDVVAPLYTNTNTLWASLDGFSLILYPFVEGEMGAVVGLSHEHIRVLGRILKRIHENQPNPDGPLAGVPIEPFISKLIDTVQKVKAKMDAGEYSDDLEKELWLFWQEKRDEIEHILARTDELGQQLQAEEHQIVLCHADIHTYNTLMTPTKELVIVDWDETLFAPKERDLMFMIGGIWGGTGDIALDEKLFFEGYGITDMDTQVDWRAHAYYRYEWVVQEIGDYGARVLLMPDFGDETRADAVRGFKSLFDTGDVVEKAYESEARVRS
ncbi:MAG: aminoglycoside phosphotransferase family protein [Chloroflexota bacterium]